MASADAVNRQRDALPPISHLELDKLRTDRPDGRFPSINGIGSSIAPMSSPSTVYSGPPPPYSYAPSASGSNQPGYISPPESTTRRSTRDDEKPSPTRNSLPSIHEALGGDRSLPFSAGSQQGTGSAPSTTISAHFPEAPKGPSNPFSAPSFRENPFSNHAVSNPPPHPPPPPDLRSRETASFARPPSPRAAAPSNFQPGPLANSTLDTRPEPQPPQSSPRQEQQRQTFSFPPVSKPPSSSYNGDSFHFPTPSANSEQRPPFPQAPEPSYDHTIKRHLDVHVAARDLNDIRETSVRLYDGCQNWTQRYHQGNRPGFFQDILPPLHEIDEMMRQSHFMMEHLARVKEVVIQQQNALSEHRARFARPIDDDYASMPDEYKSSGFAAGDSKIKRRAKVAPPGRCHSCNRAETPEWRRGPDGARTLCNACGLHYAKLTRKIGVNKAAAITGSNLRPKSLDHHP